MEELPVVCQAGQGGCAIEPIYSDELEQSLLGALILSPKQLALVEQHLDENSFYVPAHQRIYESIQHLKDNTDLLTLKVDLEDRGELANVGGEDYIIQIASDCPSPKSAEHYAARVAEFAERRRILGRLDDYRKLVEDRSMPMDLVAAEADSLIVRQPTSEFFTPFSDIELGTSDEMGVPTPFDWINVNTTSRGFPQSQTTVIRAYHKGGKTAMLTQSFSHACERGLRVVYATFADLDRQQLGRRVMRQLCGWSKRPNTGTDQWDYWASRTKLWQAGVYDAALNESGSSIEAFASWVRAYKAKFGLDFLIVDYAQELRSCRVKGYDEYSEAQLASHVLNVEIARKLKIPVVVGSQITPGRDGGKAITKGSRVWEERAGLVLTIGEDKGSIDITWNRFGPQSPHVEPMTAVWDPEHLKFNEWKL